MASPPCYHTRLSKLVQNSSRGIATSVSYSIKPSRGLTQQKADDPRLHTLGNQNTAQLRHFLKRLTDNKQLVLEGSGGSGRILQLTTVESRQQGHDLAGEEDNVLDLLLQL